MSYLKEVKKELKEKGKLENTNRKVVDILERAFVKDNLKCSKCPNTNNLTYDHIIPQGILNDFNVDASKEFWEENSDVLCHACNSKKCHHLDFSNPKTKTLLLELLSK